MEEYEIKNKVQKAFYELSPYLETFFEEEVAFTMSTTTHFIRVVNSKNIILNAKPGDPLRPGGAAYECIKAKKPVSLIVDKNVFGVAVKAVGLPVLDENGNIEGSIALARSLKIHDEILNLSKTLSNSLKEISKAANTVSSGIEAVVDANNGIISEVKDAEKNAKDTDEVLKFVKNVASQTNLLGLNAAIEAARAGEYGKGFSVVANEIRKLSNFSSESISEINNTLTKISTSVNKISESVTSTTDTFKEQLSQIQQINAALEGLSSVAATLMELAE